MLNIRKSQGDTDVRFSVAPSTSSVGSKMELEENFRRQYNSAPWKRLRGRLTVSGDVPRAGANSLSAGVVFSILALPFGPSSWSWCQGLARANGKARLETLSTKWGFPGWGCQISPQNSQPKKELNIPPPSLFR